MSKLQVACRAGAQASRSRSRRRDKSASRTADKERSTGRQPDEQPTDSWQADDRALVQRRPPSPRATECWFRALVPVEETRAETSG